MNDSSNICLSCGLCCDGTLVGFVHVDRAEIPAIKVLMELDDKNDNGFFLLPCDKLGCDGCSIYSDRPKQCRNFNCGLLNSVNENKTEINYAHTVVDEVKAKKEAILKKLVTLDLTLQSQSFYFKMLELKKLLLSKNTDITMNQQQKDVLLDIEVLDKLLAKEFGVSLSL